MIGAHPIFIEIDPDTYHLSPTALEEFILTKCRLGADGHWVDGTSGLPVTAVLPIHLYGLMADTDPILEVARKYDLKVVEDCAQAHGATYVLNGKKIKAGSLGRAGRLQLLPGQKLGAMGEGGAVTTQDEIAAQRIRLSRDHA